MDISSTSFTATQAVDFPVDTTQFDWENLRYFIAFARIRSLAAAARSLNVEHATVSRRIAALETALKVRLVDRRSHRYELTENGERIAQLGNRMQETACALSRAVCAIRTDKVADITLSAPPHLTTHFIAPHLGRLREQCPDVNVRILSNPRMASMARREADIAISVGRSASQAWEARQEGLPVSGSVVLNEIAGGIDFRVVQRSLCHHGDSEARLIVHLPTVTGRSHQSRLKRNSGHWILDKYPTRPLTVSHEGKLNEQTLDVLRMARDYPIVISTGHADALEVRLLIDAAVRLDVPRLMLNQPANPLTGLDASALLELAQAPMVYTEQTALTYLLGYQPWDDFSKVLRDVPRALYSSDLGQTSQPDIEQWQVDSLLWFERMGLGAQRAQQISQGIARELLRLEP